MESQQRITTASHQPEEQSGPGLQHSTSMTSMQSALESYVDHRRGSANGRPFGHESGTERDEEEIGTSELETSDTDEDDYRSSSRPPLPKRSRRGDKENDGYSHGRWTQEEHAAFLRGLKRYGREWKRVAADIRTRSSAQIRSHAQKYFQRLQKEKDGQAEDWVDDGEEGEDGLPSLSRRSSADVRTEAELFAEVGKLLAQLKQRREAMLSRGKMFHHQQQPPQLQQQPLIGGHSQELHQPAPSAVGAVAEGLSPSRWQQKERKPLEPLVSAGVQGVGEGDGLNGTTVAL